MLVPRNGLDRLMDGLFNVGNYEYRTYTPTLDTSQGVDVELPGVKRDKINLTATNGSLYLKAPSVSYVWRIPHGCKNEDITAHLEDGLLEIRWNIPKTLVTNIKIT